MQPCSQPRYGLIDCVKGMSGESLREMMLRAASGRTSVAMESGTDSWNQPSSTGAWVVVANRPAGLMVAPRPFNTPSMAILYRYRFGSG